MEAQLRVEDGATGRSTFTVQPGETKTLGRGSGADFKLDDAQLAERHAAVRFEDGAFQVIDLAGGVLLNGAPLPARVPTDGLSGDTITLGSHVLRINLIGRGVRRQRTTRSFRSEEAVIPSQEFDQVREIGNGAAGKVFAALWRPHGQWVAIKVLRDEIQPGSPDHERFLREGNVSRVQSPFVARVFDLRVDQGRAYIIMELVQGPSARDWLQHQLPAVPDALRVAEDVARALAAAAEQGLVHRDVKPANILLSPTGCAKLCDFGVAKDLDSTLRTLTLSGAGLGTMAYLPPEQINQAKHVDSRADVYSLGATLFHFVAGRPPFNPTSTEALIQIIDQTPPSLMLMRPDCPAPVAQVVQVMMAKDPAQRPPLWRLPDDLARLRAQLYPGHDGAHLFRAQA